MKTIRNIFFIVCFLITTFSYNMDKELLKKQWRQKSWHQQQRSFLYQVHHDKLQFAQLPVEKQTVSIKYRDPMYAFVTSDDGYQENSQN